MKSKLPYKKKHLDYLISSCWYKELITDPRQTFAEAFSCMDLIRYRQKLKMVISATTLESIYIDDSVSNLLCDFKLLESVINAAYIINRDGIKGPIIINDRDLMNANLYSGSHRDYSAWDFFPRSLSKDEYKDPYLVFPLFFGYQSLQKWKRDLQEIMEAALVSDLEVPGVDQLEIYFQLTKLLEAAHLIDVRENTHVRGQLKNRGLN